MLAHVLLLDKFVEVQRLVDPGRLGDGALLLAGRIRARMADPDWAGVRQLPRRLAWTVALRQNDLLLLDLNDALGHLQIVQLLVLAVDRQLGPADPAVVVVLLDHLPVDFLHGTQQLVLDVLVVAVVLGLQTQKRVVDLLEEAPLALVEDLLAAEVALAEFADDVQHLQDPDFLLLRHVPGRPHLLFEHGDDAVLDSVLQLVALAVLALFAQRELQLRLPAVEGQERSVRGGDAHPSEHGRSRLVALAVQQSQRIRLFTLAAEQSWPFVLAAKQSWPFILVVKQSWPFVLAAKLPWPFTLDV